MEPVLPTESVEAAPVATERAADTVSSRGRIAVTKSAAATPVEWDEAFASAVSPSFEQSRTWEEIWHDYTLGERRPETRMVTFSDGRSVLLPISTQPMARGLFRQHNVTGWLCDETLEPAHVQALVEHVRKTLGLARWELGPEFLVQLGHAVRSGEVRFEETRIVSLSRDFDAIHASWTESCRWRIRKAQKNEVVVSRATSTADWEGFYATYVDQLERWGESVTGRPYDYSFFEAFRTRACPDVDLWVAKHEDQIVAGSLCLTAQQKTASFHGASNRTGLKLGAMNVLLFEAIRDACSRGQRSFDMGTSLGIRGLEDFKDSFRPAVVPRMILRFAKPWQRLAMAVT